MISSAYAQTPNIYIQPVKHMFIGPSTYLTRFQVYPSTGAIVKNLASNVNLSYYMDLWTLGSKLQKNNCWTFFQ